MNFPAALSSDDGGVGRPHPTPPGSVCDSNTLRSSVHNHINNKRCILLQMLIANEKLSKLTHISARRVIANVSKTLALCAKECIICVCVCVSVCCFSKSTLKLKLAL